MVSDFLTRAKKNSENREAGKVNAVKPLTPAVGGTKPPTGMPKPPMGGVKPPIGMPKPPSGIPKPPTGAPKPPTGIPKVSSSTPKVSSSAQKDNKDEIKKEESPLKNPFKDNVFLKKDQENKEAAKETEIKEEVKIEETKEPIKNEPKEEPAKKEEKASQKSKTTSKKTKSKTKKEEKEEIAEEISVDVSEYKIPVSTVDFNTAVNSIRSSFVDKEYEEQKERLSNKLAEIIISNDLNKAQCHDLLSQISIIRDEVAMAYNSFKTLYEGLTAKEDGLIDRVKRLNGKGSNAEERKINGTIAAMNYVDKSGNKINLFELLDESRERYNFFKSLMDSIEFKKAILLTILSSIKGDK